MMDELSPIGGERSAYMLDRHKGAISELHISDRDAASKGEPKTCRKQCKEASNMQRRPAGRRPSHMEDAGTPAGSNNISLAGLNRL
jgi:hypothetical protein